MFERELTRRRGWGVIVLTLIACLAMVGTASAGHRPGCHSRCRNQGGLGSGPGQPPPPLMALSNSRVHRSGHFVDMRLQCLRKTKACRGVLLLNPANSDAPELARADLYVPAGKTWTLEVRLSRKGLRYLKAHQRVGAYLALVYNKPEQLDVFSMKIVSGM